MGEESSVFSEQLSMKEYQIYQISVIREQEARVAVDGLQFTVKKSRSLASSEMTWEDFGM
jgi:hypothetical protein